MNERARPAIVIAWLFAISGAAGLILETTWLRWFGLLFGATAPATAATLVAFLAGQATGAAAAARLAARMRRPLRIFAGLMIASAAWALLVPLGIGAGEAFTAAFYDELRTAPGALSCVRFAIALGATLPAAACWGAAFPTLGAALLSDRRPPGSRGAALYAANLAGAAVGAAAAAFWLPEWLGVNGTYGVGIALEVGVGVAALAMLRRMTLPAPDAEPLMVGGPLPGPRALAALASVSGFGTFAAQVLLVHAFALVLDQSVYAFGAVLAVVFVCLACGAGGVALASRSSRVTPSGLLGGSLVVTALGLACFPALFHTITGGLGLAASENWAKHLASALWMAAATAGPGLLAAGLVFPAVLAAAAPAPDAPRPVAARLGQLVAANTLGALLGAVAAPFLLLPFVGPWRAFAVVGLVYGVASLFVPTPDRRGRMLRDGVLALGWLGILALASPFSLPAVTPEAGETLVYQVTTPSGSVAVIERDGEHLIRSDNHYNLGGTAEVLHQERQGHLPLLLHPDARRVAYLGSATGISAGAATLHPVTSMHLVEIAPGVADAARRYFRAANRQVHEDPRTRIVLDDARNFLRASRERFDVIVADLFVPWRSGSHALYALEHFQAARARLDSGGLFCQWLPLYQLTPGEFQMIAATFLDAFPESAVFRGDFYGSFPIAALVGWRDRPAPFREVSAAAARMAAIPGFDDRWLRDPVGFWSLYVGPLAGLATVLRDVPRNRDDRPRFAYLAARSHVGGGRGVSDPMVGLRWVRFQETLQRASQLGGNAIDPGDAIYPGLDARAREASHGGALLQAASSLWVAGRAQEAAQFLARASELLPPELLAQAPADPSAADVWPD